MHKYIDEYEPAPEWRESDALDIFPFKEMGAEEYAAREAHNWASFSYDNYIYKNKELNEWLHTLGDIFYGKNKVNEARKKHLTEEEIKSIEKIQNEPF
jgi:hypothetical protein